MPWIFPANFPLNINIFGEYAFSNLSFLFKVQIRIIFSYFYNVKAYLCSFFNELFKYIFGYHVLGDSASSGNFDVLIVIEFDLLPQYLFRNKKWQNSVYLYSVNKWSKYFEVFLVKAL